MPDEFLAIKQKAEEANLEMTGKGLKVGVDSRNNRKSYQLFINEVGTKIVNYEDFIDVRLE